MKTVAALVPKIGQKPDCLGQAEVPQRNLNRKKPVKSVRSLAEIRKFLNGAMVDSLPKIGGMGKNRA